MSLKFTFIFVDLCKGIVDVFKKLCLRSHYLIFLFPNLHSDLNPKNAKNYTDFNLFSCMNIVLSLGNVYKRSFLFFCLSWDVKESGYQKTSLPSGSCG